MDNIVKMFLRNQKALEDVLKVPEAKRNYIKYLANNLFEVKVRDKDLILTFKTYEDVMLSYTEHRERLKKEIDKVNPNSSHD